MAFDALFDPGEQHVSARGRCSCLRMTIIAVQGSMRGMIEAGSLEPDRRHLDRLDRHAPNRVGLNQWIRRWSKRMALDKPTSPEWELVMGVSLCFWFLVLQRRGF